MKMFRTALIGAILSIGLAGTALASQTCGTYSETSPSGPPVVNLDKLSSKLKSQASSACLAAGKKSYSVDGWTTPKCTVASKSWSCSGCLNYTCK